MSNGINNKEVNQRKYDVENIHETLIKLGKFGQLIKNTLYISFDGLSDPLGQSQILPYITGIASNGYHITILSCEKKEKLNKNKASVEKTLSENNISWRYVLYDQEGGFFSRYSYLRTLGKMAAEEHKKKKFCLVHCRSYLPSLIGLHFKTRLHIPFIFDMRGFWADERIDGGIWNKTNPLHNFFYRYFKKKEKQFIQKADVIVSLTKTAVNYLENQHPGTSKKCLVIPCCVNTAIFDPAKANKREISGIDGKDHVIIYTGSIGTWYFTKEMIDCVLVWKKKIPELKLLVVTQDQEALTNILAGYNAEDKKIVASISATYSEIPSLLALAKSSMFFIKPAFSKKASSPTKMAECWAMNLPIISNSGIGDNDFYFEEKNGGVLIHEFTADQFEKACDKYLNLLSKNGNYREIALNNFDTAWAVKTYTSIYDSICHAKS